MFSLLGQELPLLLAGRGSALSLNLDPVLRVNITISGDVILDGSGDDSSQAITPESDCTLNILKGAI